MYVRTWVLCHALGKNGDGNGEMVHLAKMLATKSDDPSSVSGTHMGEEKKRTELGVAVHTFNPSAEAEAEAGGSL